MAGWFPEPREGGSGFQGWCEWVINGDDVRYGVDL